MLSLRQFQQFLAVAETMSFRRAAERLNMAQPPLTAAIRQMEEELGVRLFERSNRITGLTAAGEVLNLEARRTIVQAERAVTMAKLAGKGSIGTLRIGFVASAVRYLVPHIVTTFRRTHPMVVLELEEAPTARQISAIMADSMDVGIIALPIPLSAEPHVSTKLVMESRLIAAIPAGHPLALSSSSPLTLASLANESWVIFPGEEGPGLYGAILRACAEAGFTPHVTQRAIQMETIIGLVAAGLGVALVPELFRAPNREGVIFRDLVGIGTPISYRVGLVWQHGQSSAVLSSFLQSVTGLEQKPSID
ncbi:LysR family transcriptional regulator [Serratia entomophila]|uniref:LysR family transcriptional regulator n=1 Tax=Serratia entomophila TaxID=42906 RepID=A0ABY5CQA8_9GAMM|nr:LysR family transcriptional regulator [Serratia entomophila]USV00079.1 LysR family transcriptional regulator [Serratia entomophila]CAI0932692.1 Ben and cat operon transcriptional regulator [Serratia entomophila]CAI0940967.1 Ben and cat operon transcriptional regulator [Serratia entomophila]CAI0948561.1 Ben and cat operon transcriptional regulator [Serratia entomophila]CAI0958797.1 Ben and cat operon transcriptional regulator [Serratia entomophila]